MVAAAGAAAAAAAVVVAVAVAAAGTVNTADANLLLYCSRIAGFAVVLVLRLYQ